MTGIIIALKSEFQVTDRRYKHQNINGFDVYANARFAIIYSGVGKANAGAAATLLIEKYKADKIFNVGSVGTVTRKLKILDVVNCQRIQYFDVDITKFGYRPNQMAREKEFFESTYVLTDVKTTNATLYTGETFVDAAQWKRTKIKDKMAVVDMEGCGIAQICDKAKIQYAIIKVVSDSIYTQKRSEKQWEENIKKVNEIIEGIVFKIESI